MSLEKLKSLILFGVMCCLGSSHLKSAGSAFSHTKIIDDGVMIFKDQKTGKTFLRIVPSSTVPLSYLEPGASVWHWVMDINPDTGLPEANQPPFASSSLLPQDSARTDHQQAGNSGSVRPQQMPSRPAGQTAAMQAQLRTFMSNQSGRPFEHPGSNFINPREAAYFDFNKAAKKQFRRLSSQDFASYLTNQWETMGRFFYANYKQFAMLQLNLYQFDAFREHIKSFGEYYEASIGVLNKKIEDDRAFDKGLRRFKQIGDFKNKTHYLFLLRDHRDQWAFRDWARNEAKEIAEKQAQRRAQAQEEKAQEDQQGNVEDADFGQSKNQEHDKVPGEQPPAKKKSQASVANEQVGEPQQAHAPVSVSLTSTQQDDSLDYDGIEIVKQAAAYALDVGKRASIGVASERAGQAVQDFLRGRTRSRQASQPGFSYNGDTYSMESQFSRPIPGVNLRLGPGGQSSGIRLGPRSIGIRAGVEQRLAEDKAKRIERKALRKSLIKQATMSQDIPVPQPSSSQQPLPVQPQIILDQQPWQQEQHQAQPAFDPLGMEGFRFTARDGASISAEIAKIVTDADAYMQEAYYKEQAHTFDNLITTFTNIAVLYNKAEDFEQAYAAADLSRHFVELAKKLDVILQAIEDGIGIGQKNAHDLVDHVMMDPLDVVADMTDSITQVSLAMSPLMLKILEQDHLALAQDFLSYARATSDHLGKMPWEEKLKKTTTFVSDFAVIWATDSAFMGPGLGAVSAAAKSLNDLLKAEHLAAHAHEMYKTALSVSTQAAEKIRKCLAPCETALAGAAEMAGVSAELGIPATKNALETIQKNPQLLQQEGKGIAQVVRETALESGVPTGTVWDSIKVIDPMYPNTRIPKSFEIAAGGKRFWVAPNATKHMQEYIAEARIMSHGMPIDAQSLLKSFQAAVDEASKNGIRYTIDPIVVGPWELMFSPPRVQGMLPVVKHALYRP